MKIIVYHVKSSILENNHRFTYLFLMLYIYIHLEHQKSLGFDNVLSGYQGYKNIKRDEKWINLGFYRSKFDFTGTVKIFLFTL